jgi:uncharacterized SAM-binding protein YcdF (DUF218 family)
MPPDALVVLGCRVRQDGQPCAALERRVALAAELYRSGVSRNVVMSGGRAWHGVVEADAMLASWIARGLPREAVTLERSSLTTRGNAHCCAELLRGQGWREVAVVTCDFHLARAKRHFRATGLDVVGYAAHVERPLSRRVLLFLRELGARLIEPWGRLRT